MNIEIIPVPTRILTEKDDIAEAIYSLSQDDIKRGKYAQQAKISMRQYDIKNISLKMWDIYMSCL